VWRETNERSIGEARCVQCAERSSNPRCLQRRTGVASSSPPEEMREAGGTEVQFIRPQYRVLDTLVCRLRIGCGSRVAFARDSSRAEGTGVTARGNQAAVMWSGLLTREILRRVRALRGPEPTVPEGLRVVRVDASQGKRSEPLPVPGCNKPGTSMLEKTAEVVRDHEGGTRCCDQRWSQPEATRRFVGAMWEWTATREVGGGALE
jgi:hypothetical protein